MGDAVVRVSMGPEANRPIKTLLVMEDVLSVLVENEGADLATVVESVDRTKSVVYDHLSTLEQMDYVVKEDGTYQLSLHWLKRGRRVRNQASIYEIVMPEIRRLARGLDTEMVTFAVEEQGRIVAIEAIQTREDIEYDTKSGMYFPMHCSAAGKAILAHVSEERVHDVVDRHGLPSFTEETITSRDALLDELDEIRDSGVSYEFDEYHDGMATISVPIIAPGGDPLGAVSITGPSHHVSEPDVKSSLTNELLSTVNIIELNYSS
jgi:DNA-binding IclR family transcriptional regulator